MAPREAVAVAALEQRLQGLAADEADTRMALQQAHTQTVIRKRTSSVVLTAVLDAGDRGREGG